MSLDQSRVRALNGVIKQLMVLSSKLMRPETVQELANSVPLGLLALHEHGAHRYTEFLTDLPGEAAFVDANVRRADYPGAIADREAIRIAKKFLKLSAEERDISSRLSASLNAEVKRVRRYPLSVQSLYAVRLWMRVHLIEDVKEMWEGR